MLHDYKQQFRLRTPTLLGYFAIALITLASGCRTPVQREVYSSKMASEIRVLEDQLYEADYENEVLRQNLRRAKECCDSDPTSSVPYAEPEPYLEQPVLPNHSPMIVEDEGQVLPPPVVNEFDMGQDLNETQVDPSFQPEPIQTPVPVPNSVEELPAPLTDPTGDENKDSEFVPRPPSSSEGILPPPTEPQPPGPNDTPVPPIVPGEIVPPPVRGENIETPPGKIDLGSRQNQTPKIVPTRLRLHTGLSGGHQFDGSDKVDGMYLVVNVLDSNGQMIDVSEFDIDAEMTIIALDPKRTGDEARIGRWEFSTRDVMNFIRKSPVSGFHVPIKWQDALPTADNVIVHVRLKTEDEEMRCEAELKVKEVESIADWTPRGNKTR